MRRRDIDGTCGRQFREACSAHELDVMSMQAARRPVDERTGALVGNVLNHFPPATTFITCIPRQIPSKAIHFRVLISQSRSLSQRAMGNSSTRLRGLAEHFRRNVIATRQYDAVQRRAWPHLRGRQMGSTTGIPRRHNGVTVACQESIASRAALVRFDNQVAN